MDVFSPREAAELTMDDMEVGSGDWDNTFVFQVLSSRIAFRPLRSVAFVVARPTYNWACPPWGSPNPLSRRPGDV